MTRLDDTAIRSLATHFGLDPDAAVGHYADMMNKVERHYSIAASSPSAIRLAIASEAFAECDRQDEKWGEQNHPNGTGPDLTFSLPTDHDGEAHASVLAEWAKERTDDAARRGEQTYEHIATEEFFEALAEVDPTLLRTELIQLIAVLIQWVAKIDRDAARFAATVEASRILRTTPTEARS